MKIPIPDDWDGESWQCLQVQWPDSILYTALLVGFLSQMTRGRFWDERTGSILSAQAVGVEVFNANFPFVSCDGETTEPLSPEVLGLMGGAADEFESEDEMPIYVNVETNELVYVCGCKEYRFPLEAGAPQDALEGATNQQGDDQDPGVPVIPDGWETGYTTCGAATELINRMYAVGAAAWANRSSPSAMAGAIKAANPGYSVAMMWVTPLWISCQELALIEGFGDADIFNAEAKKNWKCYIRNMLSGDFTQAELFSKTEWSSITFWPLSFAILDEVPDAGSLFDVVWAGFWENVCNLIGRHRAAQICYESAGSEETCEDCDTPNPPAIDYQGNLVWTGTISTTPSDPPVVLTWLNQGRTLNVKAGPSDAGGYQGLPDGTQFGLQVVGGSPIEEWVMVVEMVTGNISGNWHTSDCGNTDMPTWDGSSSAVETHEDFLGGNSRTTFDTSGTPWTGAQFVVENVRFCPHDDLEGQYTEWNMHIIEVDGVATGVTDPFEGMTPP